MYGEQVFDINNTEGTRKKLNHRRARKACQQCHVRKIRCNVVERGPPCSNCVDAGKECTIRARKNERSSRNPSPSSEHKQRIRERCYSWQLGDAGASENASNGQTDKGPQEGSLVHQAPVTDPTYQAWNNFDTGLNWSSTTNFPDLPPTDHGAGSGGIDLTYLADLNDIFDFTRETTLPDFTNFGLPTTYSQQECNPQTITPMSHLSSSTPNNKTNVDTGTIGIQIPGLSASEEEYLRREGCLTLPPIPLFKEMMRAYFYMVHPNLPMVLEDQFWALWRGDSFQLDNYSFVLVKAMIFASINYMESETFLNIGMTKREARLMYYKQAKVLFEFGVEKDPVASAQASLLLTYYAPNYNVLRVNTYWLTQAIRFAKVAKADLHYRRRETDVRSSQLRRLWWCIIMRDRILSLGLRRSRQVPLDPPAWEDEEAILQASDFQSELGQSPVHDRDTQHRIIEVISMTCRLMQTLTRPLQLYHHEHLHERLKAASHSPPSAVADTYAALADLRKWHDHAIRHFPFPIALDDAFENPSVCIYANLMFCYHSSAVFALNQHLILLSSAFPAPTTALISLEAAREALESANHDIGRRVQEWVQVRLTKYVPISLTAYFAVPMVLQAINVAAARGTSTEGVENRRLEVFLRTLKVLQENFDGSDHCADVLANVVAYAQADEKFISSMTNWRGGGGGGAGAGSLPSSPGPAKNKVKLDWPNMVFKRPRLFLRLMFYLDYALCAGGPPEEEDFPAELRKDLASTTAFET